MSINTLKKETVKLLKDHKLSTLKEKTEVESLPIESFT